MEDKDKIWILFARKLSGEASEQDLFEFEMLMKRKPELMFYFEFFSRLWKQPRVVYNSKIEDCYKTLAHRLFEDELKLISFNRIVVEKFKYNFSVN